MKENDIIVIYKVIIMIKSALRDTTLLRKWENINDPNQINNELFLDIFKNLENHENAILNKEAIFNIFKLLVLAAEGETLEMLNKHENIKNAINFISKSSPMENHKVTLFLRNGINSINNEYKKQIQEIFNKNNVTFDIQKLETKDDLKFHIQIEVTSKGQWKYPLKIKESGDDNDIFNILPNKSEKVTMLTLKNTSIHTVIAKKFGILTCDIFKFPLKDEKYSVLIILPQKISTAKELTNNIIPNMSNIIKIINGEGREYEYDEIRIPYIYYEREYELIDSLSKVPILRSMINNFNIDGMYKEEWKGYSISLNTKLIVQNTARIEVAESSPSTNVIRLNRPFVHCTCDEINNEILQVGTFTTPILENNNKFNYFV